MIPEKIAKNGTNGIASEVLCSLIDNVYCSGETCFNCKHLDTCPHFIGETLVEFYRDLDTSLMFLISAARGSRLLCLLYDPKPRGG